MTTAPKRGAVWCYDFHKNTNRKPHAESLKPTAGSRTHWSAWPLEVAKMATKSSLVWLGSICEVAEQIIIRSHWPAITTDIAYHDILFCRVKCYLFHLWTSMIIHLWIKQQVDIETTTDHMAMMTMSMTVVKWTARLLQQLGEVSVDRVELRWLAVDDCALVELLRDPDCSDAAAHVNAAILESLDRTSPHFVGHLPFIIIYANYSHFKHMHAFIALI